MAESDQNGLGPEEAFPRIRPAWLIGGTAVVIFLGICTLISLCAAVVLIWFSNQMSSREAEATQVAFQSRTEQAVITAAPRLITPTALPTPTMLPPPPTVLFSLPTQIAVLISAPDQAVRTYYQLVSQKRYDLTWSLLTDAFKQKFNCCAPNYNYSDYVSWWDSVNHVEFGDVRTVSQSGERAVVYTELYYVMNTSARSSLVGDPYIELVYDSTTDNWRFNDKRSTP